MKCYLRELPEPVIPFDCYHPLIDAAKLSRSGEDSIKANTGCETSKEKEEAMKLIKDQIVLFPEPNYDLLKLVSIRDAIELQYTNR